MKIDSKQGNTMQSEHMIRESFQEMGRIIEELQHVAEKMLTVMDKQINAITAAKNKEIEKYTEEYSELRGRFNEQEENFVQQLHQVLDLPAGSEQEVRLDHLKKLFPDAASTIDEWKQLIEAQAIKLKKKHDRVVELLDFALNRNANLMHAIYSLNNRKNTHYSSGGRKEEISSGMAVNKEA
jgi:phosphoglucomutase